MTRSGLGHSRTSAHNSDIYHSISPSLGVRAVVRAAIKACSNVCGPARLE
jgi:hypothetical protein